MIPFSDQPRHSLSVEQMKQRHQWMAEEAQRLIEARQATQHHPQPVQINQVFDPRMKQPPTQDQLADAAGQLIARLKARDRSSDAR